MNIIAEQLKHFFTWGYLLKIILIVLAYFAPIQPLVLAAFVFATCDFITGIFAARKKAQIQKIANWCDSRKMQKKVFDLVFYLVGIILSFYFEKLFLGMINFPLSKIVAFIILSVEFWSNMENLSVITGLPLNKTAFFEVVNKMRGSTAKQ